MKKLWKEVSGYDGDYLVSNDGEIKSLKIIPIILKQRKDRRGFLSL